MEHGYIGTRANLGVCSGEPYTGGVVHSMLLHLALSATLATGTPGVPFAYRVAGDSAEQASGKTYVAVENGAFNDAVVYAIQGLRVVRLGNVSGLSKQKLVLPRDMATGGQAIRFAIRPIGGRRNSYSDGVSVYTGDTVRLYIPYF